MHGQGRRRSAQGPRQRGADHGPHDPPAAGPVRRLERGNEFPRALQVCVLNKVPAEDRKVIQETFEHHVGPNGAGQGIIVTGLPANRRSHARRQCDRWRARLGVSYECHARASSSAEDRLMRSEAARARLAQPVSRDILVSAKRGNVATRTGTYPNPDPGTQMMGENGQSRVETDEYAVAIYHVVYSHEDFNHAAHTLFKLVQEGETRTQLGKKAENSSSISRATGTHRAGSIPICWNSKRSS